MEKIIYGSESSSLEASFDGELIELMQTFEGQVVGVISLYRDELEEISKFIESEVNSDEES